MRILGIDPGIAIVGWGIIDYAGIGTKCRPVAYGAITTGSDEKTEDRILTVYDEMTAVIAKYKPDCAAVEELFFNTNQKTGIIVAEARGVLLLACRQAGLPIYEYTPLQIKQAVVGYGNATKHQVQEMTKRLLHLQAMPKPDDAADAIAIALCHARSSTSLLAQAQCQLK